jgi:uncharacterized damage-inducible protein DinB
MDQVQRILQHYDASLHGDAWHGDAVWTILESVSLEEAAARSLAGAHSIWEIVSHMTFWEGVATTRLAGGKAGLVEELNFPAMPAATAEHWRKTLDDFGASNERFRQALQQLDPARLDELTAAGKRTYYGEAHGIIEHNIYHAGQIALLRKK